MYITEGEKIKAKLIYGSKSAMSLEEIILEELKEWDNSPVFKDMKTGNAYYRYEQKADGIKSGFFRKITKQKTDYLLSKPFSVLTENTAYLEQLNVIFDDYFRASLKRCGTQSVTKGIGWKQVYFEDNKIAFMVIPSEEVKPLWTDAEHKKLDAVIRRWYRTEYEGKTAKRVCHVEYWSADGVKRYIHENGNLIPDVENGDEGHHFTINGKGYNWERVPFVAFKYNDDELPLIKGLQGAIDDYDAQKNTMAQLLRDVPEFIYVLRNYGGIIGDDGNGFTNFLETLRKNRGLLVDEDGGVDKLTADINIDAYDTFMQQARKDIYEFGRAVDTQAVDLGNASGQALKFRYADLDNDCNDMEAEFKAGLQNVLWFVNVYLKIMGKGDFFSETVDFVFNRDTIINEAEAIQMCTNSKDIVSDETILNNHPWVEDTQEELERLKVQQEENIKRQQGMFGMVPNTPPGGDE